MNDRELLEMAAKAAGMDVWFDDNGAGWISGDKYRWNPMENDGDALRLAMKLGMHIRFFRKHVDVDPEPFVLSDSVISESFTGGRKEEAARRAIVRAAAEIGKSNGGAA